MQKVTQPMAVPLYEFRTASPESSDMSGSFQSGFGGGGGDYDYGGHGVDKYDHYGGHSGYET